MNGGVGGFEGQAGDVEVDQDQIPVAEIQRVGQGLQRVDPEAAYIPALLAQTALGKTEIGKRIFDIKYSKTIDGGTSRSSGNILLHQQTPIP